MSDRTLYVIAALIWAQFLVSLTLAFHDYERRLQAPFAWSLWPLFLAGVALSAWLVRS